MGESGSEDAEWMGMVAEVGSRCGGLERSEFDCRSVGDANLPETLDDGLDVVIIVGNKGECGKSVFSTLDNRNGRTS